MLTISPSKIDHDSVVRDIESILWSMKLYKVRRYFHQRFWEVETQQAEYAQKIEPHLRLESVAEHSWHVADIILLLGSYFPSLDIGHCLKLAILHDKMEIKIGDKNPVGKDGTGLSTHAFNINKREKKDTDEREAIEFYVSRLRHTIRKEQEHYLTELLECSSEEANFVKAIDKLQALAYVYIKKGGNINLNHLKFTLHYSNKIIEYYPGLNFHYKELLSRVIDSVATENNITVKELLNKIEGGQLKLPF